MDAGTLPALSECRWYHSMDLPEIGMVKGDWDLRGRFDEYICQVSLSGRSVLDVGAASGFLSFEAERRGASVTSFDAESPRQLQMVPPKLPDANYFSGMRESYRVAHRAFHSNATLVLGDISAMADTALLSDIVIVGQILVHLRDPLSALEQAARCAKSTLIIAEGMIDTDDTVARFIGHQAAHSWWQYSVGTFREWLRLLGFILVHRRTSNYRCNVVEHDVAITTLVANRDRAGDRLTPPDR